MKEHNRSLGDKTWAKLYPIAAYMDAFYRENGHESAAMERVCPCEKYMGKYVLIQ